MRDAQHERTLDLGGTAKRTLRRLLWLAIVVCAGLCWTVACRHRPLPASETPAPTATATMAATPEPIEVTRVVERVVEITPEPTKAPAATRELVVCISAEPDSLYRYGSDMPQARAVRHAIFTNYITNLSFAYQADGLAKLPSLADGDAQVTTVIVNAGDSVLTAADQVKALEAGDIILSAGGEEVVFDGQPLEVAQLVVDFTMLSTVWSDGAPVAATDSVYAFNVAADPDTPASKYAVERTAAYEATGDLSVRWTGLPGFLDRAYVTRFWQPLPEHALGDYSALELLDAGASSREPIGDGPFVVDEWLPGRHIRLVRNEHYYRAAEGLPRLDRVTFRFIPDADQLLFQLYSGQCDIGTPDGLSVALTPSLLEAQTAGLLVPYFQTGQVYEQIAFNIEPYDDGSEARYDWFEDARVRQAITLCTDRQRLIDELLFGRSELLNTYVPGSHPLYPADHVVEWPYDPEAGNSLLDEAGFGRRDLSGFRLDPSGQRFAPTLGATTGNPLRQGIAAVFRENMAACGIDAQLFFQPPAEWYAGGPEGILFGRRFDLGELAWLAGTEPPCDLYTSVSIPGPAGEINPRTGAPYAEGWAGQNVTGYASSEFDTACEMARRHLPGTPEFEQGHREAAAVFSRDLPAMPLFLRLKVAATRPHVLNFTLDATEESTLYNIDEIDIAQ